MDIEDHVNGQTNFVEFLQFIKKFITLVSPLR